MKRLLASTIFILSVLMIQSCGEKPKKEDLQGCWVSNNGASITLYGDSTFTARNLPAKVFIEDDSSGLFYGKGIWYIKKEQEYDHYSIELIFKKRNNYECNSGTFILINGSGILEIKSPWTSLFGWVGEAAEGNRFEFFRK